MRPTILSMHVGFSSGLPACDGAVDPITVRLDVRALGNNRGHEMKAIWEIGQMGW